VALPSAVRPGPVRGVEVSHGNGGAEGRSGRYLWLIDAVIANPSAYGFTNVTQPVWSGNLTNSNSGTLAATGTVQDGYLFFDGLHPTAQADSLLAEAVSRSLTVSA